MHDVIVIGGGPAGLAAAFWCDELGLDTLLLEQREQLGGQLHSIFGPIENYPGIIEANGEAFFARFLEHVERADFDVWTSVQIESVDCKSKHVRLASGEDLQAIALVIATGVRRRELGIPGEKEFAGHGIIDSGRRDRERLAGRDVCVIGGGDAAAENALLLADVCPTVTLVHRGKHLRARSSFVQELHGKHCITVFPESVVTRILGDGEVAAVEIRRKEALKPFQMAVQGVVIRIGVEPNTELFHSQIALNEKNYVITSNGRETSIANVFAIGDVANPFAPTISGAAGDGATVAKVIGHRLQTR